MHEIKGRDVCDVCRREHAAGADHRCGGDTLARAVERAIQAGLFVPSPFALGDVPRDILAWAVWIAKNGKGVAPRVSEASREHWGAAAYPAFVRITHDADELYVGYPELLTLAHLVPFESP